MVLGSGGMGQVGSGGTRAWKMRGPVVADSDVIRECTEIRVSV